jgi:hypothetical protein
VGAFESRHSSSFSSIGLYEIVRISLSAGRCENFLVEVNRDKALTMGDLTAELPPQPLSGFSQGLSVGKYSSTNRPAAVQITASTSSSKWVMAFSQAT